MRERVGPTKKTVRSLTVAARQKQYDNGMKNSICLLLLCATLLFTGCAEHYRHVRVVDSSTGQTYYARYATNSRLGMSFKDAKTGEIIRIDGSTEVFDMSKEDFEKAIAE